MSNDQEAQALKHIFGEHLREARKVVGLTQEALALHVGLDRTYISLLERGIKSPTLTTFIRLCRGLDQEPGLFLAQVNELLLQRGEECDY